MTFLGHLVGPGGQWTTFVDHLGGPWRTVGDFVGQWGVPGGQRVTFVGHLRDPWGTMGCFCRSLWGSVEDSG